MIARQSLQRHGGPQTCTAAGAPLDPVPDRHGNSIRRCIPISHGRERVRIDTGDLGHARDIVLPRLAHERVSPVHPTVDKGLIKCAATFQLSRQGLRQHDIRAGFDLQIQIRLRGDLDTFWINDNQLCALRPCLFDD